MTRPSDITQQPFQYLKEDHKKASELLKKLESTTENAVKTRAELFAQIDHLLSLHMELEENTLYPFLEETKKTHELTLESKEEHHVIKVLLKELETSDQTTEEWTMKVKVLEENVTHHVEEEEKTDGLFKQAESVMNEEEIETLRRNMEAYLSQ